MSILTIFLFIFFLFLIIIYRRVFSYYHRRNHRCKSEKKIKDDFFYYHHHLKRLNEENLNSTESFNECNNKLILTNEEEKFVCAKLNELYTMRPDISKLPSQLTSFMIHSNNNNKLDNTIGIKDNNTSIATQNFLKFN